MIFPNGAGNSAGYEFGWNILILSPFAPLLDYFLLFVIDFDDEIDMNTFLT